jgi:hypothetical protein
MERNRVPETEVSKAVFRVKQSKTTTKQGPGDLLESGPKDVYELTIELPGRNTGMPVWLRPPQASL